ncbi:oxidoreductase [Thermomonas paludicola]|uniref:oxidoreductase n=1 Tax=Thermomonas paludicola TaxID=2884874 RepID=UPI002115B324|nr:oxidoreductase [Thermomonas paludicola]
MPKTMHETMVGTTMTKQHVLLVGATGLVGQGVLDVLLRAPEVSAVTVLVRRPFPAAHDKVRVLQVAEFTGASLSALDLAGLDACFYCAGPLPVGMSEADYRDATVGALQHVVEAYAAVNPAGFVAYVSGLGANPRSRLMPLRVKGQAEQMLASAGIAHACLRPGVIRPVLAERSPHAWRRIVYVAGAPLLAFGSRFLPSVFTTTQAIGDCMLCLALKNDDPPRIVENLHIVRTRTSRSAA